MTMLKAVGNKVIIEVFDKRNETRSGIVLPVTNNNAFVPHSGIVSSVGKAVRFEDIKVGKKVAIEKYVGNKVQWEGKDYLVLNENDIVAILPDDIDVSTREEDKNYKANL